MDNILLFPGVNPPRPGFERVKAVYTAGDIRRQFGLSEHLIRRWTREGLIPTAAGSRPGEFRFDFHALSRFRRARELRNQGLSTKQIEAELRGQMNLFPAEEGQVIAIPARRSPFEEAIALHEQNNPAAAEFYRRAIDEEDFPVDAYCNLGILEFDRGDEVAAFDCFTRALALDPRHFEAHLNLAHLYFECGDLALARLHYELAARIEPGFADLYFNLGVLHAVKGNFAEAVDVLKKAKELGAEEEGKKVDELLIRIASILRSSAADPV